MWKCDGKDCNVRGTIEEVEGHILADATNPDGLLKEPKDIKCWGAIGVGSDEDQVDTILVNRGGEVIPTDLLDSWPIKK